jgi:adenylate kinase family enzyme
LNRIAIIGNAGGGKSTLARKLGESLHIPVHHIDLLQWKPGWMRASADEFDYEHDQWLASPEWIIDGWGRWDVIVTRFDLADTIVFVDFQIALHYGWAIKRQVQSIVAPRPDWPPPGCSATSITWRLFRLMWDLHRNTRPKLLELVMNYRDRKRVEHIRSPRELERFLQAAVTQTNETGQTA